MNNSTEGKSPKQIFNTVKIMHLAICTGPLIFAIAMAVSYTHLRAHETVLDIVCRLLLENKKQ